ncbi:MAG: PAS domain S-box protein [Ginsengibacter sp.]
MENQHPRLFNVLPLPGLILLPDLPTFTIQEVNNAFLRATNTIEKDWVGKSLLTVDMPLYSHSLTYMKASLAQVLTTKEPQKMPGTEHGFINHDPVTQPIISNHVENIPLMDESGVVTGILQMITCDTKLSPSSLDQLQKIESFLPGNEATARSLSYLNKIMDASLDVICVIDEQGYFRRVNAACERIWGYKPEELIGKLFTDFVHHEDHDISNMTTARLMAGNQFTFFENRYKHKNGTVVPMEWRVGWVEEERTRVGIGRDITEQKKSAEQSHLNEMRFRALVQEGSDLIAILDSGANYTYVSPTSYSILGTQPEEYIGKNAFDFIHPEDKGAVVAAFDMLQSDKQIKNIEFRFCNKEGDWRWIETTLTNLINDPSIKGIVANSRDITERKLVEQASGFKAELLNRIGQAVIGTSIDGTINFWNSAAENIYGWKANEVIDKNIIDVVPSLKSKIRLELIMKQLNKGKTWSGEFKVQRKNRTEFPALVTDSPLYNKEGKLSGILSVSSDITERKQAENELGESETRYRTLFEHNLAGLYTSTLDGIILDCNPAFARMLKYESPDELLDKNAVEIYFSNEDREGFAKEVSEQKSLSNHEYILKCKDGSSLYVIENVVLRKASTSGKEILDGILIDITERKLAELQLKYVNERLTNASKATFDVIWDWDLRSNELYLGNAFEKLFGYKLESNDTHISAWYEHLHNDDAEMVMNSINEVINDENNNYWRQEYRFIKANGDIAFVADRGFVLRDDSGQAYRIVGAMHDSTKRKQNDFALQQSEARQRGIIASQTSYVIRTDLEGNYSYYNQKFFNDFGWMYGNADVTGMPAMKSIMEYHHKKVRLAVEKCITSLNEVFQVEIDKPGKDGDVITTLWDFICLTNADGFPSEIQCVGIDISLRKKAEENFIKTLEEKNTILESIGDGFFAVDQDWTVTYWNNKAEEMLMKSREEVLGHNLWESFREKLESETFNKYLEAVTNQESIQFEEYNPTLNKWYEVSAYPSEGGLSVYFKDITERKLAADAIHLSNERYDLVALATNDCLWDWDLVSNQVERPGKKIEKLLGYEEIEASQVDEFWRQHVHPDDWKRISETRQTIFNNPEEKFWEDEYRFLTHAGKYALIYDRGYVIRDAQGKAVRIIGAARDVSIERESEIALKELNNQLQIRAKELADSNAELEQFAYVASHDLQEPLRMVTGFLTQLEKKYGDVIDDTGKKYIDFAVDGARRMRQIILDLL